MPQSPEAPAYPVFTPARSGADVGTSPCPRAPRQKVPPTVPWRPLLATRIPRFTTPHAMVRECDERLAIHTPLLPHLRRSASFESADASARFVQNVGGGAHCGSDTAADQD